MATALSLPPESLHRLFLVYSSPPPTAGYALFALRGALPDPAPSGWTAAVRLVPAAVDHLHMRCTIGIWDAGGGRLFAAPGSTVPHAENVAKAAARGGKGANQVEPGYYTDLTKGEHLQGKLNGHEALRQTASRFYRRSPRGLPYSAKSPLFYGNPYDNLHCGWNLDGKEPGFRSAGCMVVAGMPHCPRHEKPEPNRGAWKTFHDLLYRKRQASFPILILPADEAAAALRDGVPGPSRLVFGSRGEQVEALQRQLKARERYKGPVDGWLGPRTYRAWKRA